MIEKIGHYSLTSPASVYDEEALTALELAGRTAAKVNQAVDAFNTLEEETGNHLQEQDNRITKMNNETMPQKVTSEVQKQIDNGTFDKQISDYAGGLEDRLDNLLGSITEGGTSMDAEVIDARMMSDGTVKNTVGEAMRYGFNHTHEMGVFSQVRFPTVEIDTTNKKVIFNYIFYIHANRVRYDIQPTEVSYENAGSAIFYVGVNKTDKTLRATWNYENKDFVPFLLINTQAISLGTYGVFP